MYFAPWTKVYESVVKGTDELRMVPADASNELNAGTHEISAMFGDSVLRTTDGLLVGIVGLRDYFSYRDQPEDYQCRAEARKMLLGRKVTFKPDVKLHGYFVEWPQTMQVHASLEDGTDVGGMLISLGYAIGDDRFNHDLKAEYQKLEDAAYKKGLCYWKNVSGAGTGESKKSQ